MVVTTSPVEFIKVGLCVALISSNLVQVGRHSTVGTTGLAVNSLVVCTISNSCSEGRFNTLAAGVDLGRRAVVLFDAFEILYCGYFLLACSEVRVDSVAQIVVWLGGEGAAPARNGRKRKMG
jgi:hypothetical protein